MTLRDGIEKTYIWIEEKIKQLIIFNDIPIIFQNWMWMVSKPRVGNNYS